MSQLKKTIKVLRRSPYQALAAALAMSLTFFVSSIFLVLIVGGQIILNYIEQRPQVIAFFKDDTTVTQINEVIKQVEASGFTSKVKYVSKDEALAIYRERNKDDPLLLESVSADFLPASIDISVKRAADIDEITKIAKERKEVDKVITPDIGMRIAIRRDEISIMTLVGATKWYIARPFFIEGALYGIVGATIAVLLIYALLLFYSPNIQDFLGPIQIFPISPLFFVYLWVGEALVAVAVGIIGATIALLRYLKVK
ncbi:FtsX-like permease family protein [Candidatus Curtissbacteria bacterium]|nr:FtsX-like permease family protein [Candidatus Curtissbacteria bacterium]